MAGQPTETRNWGATIWPLVTGLAVGFLVGRETGGPSRSASSDSGEQAAAEPAKAAAPNQPTPPPPPPPPAGAKKLEIPAHSPRKGAKHGKVTIVEFSEFQCPFCKRVGPTLQEIEQKYGKDVTLVWMHQPLPFHDHAMDAALAFQAAWQIAPDKAWKLHDKLFENQTSLTRENIEKLAGEVGLNVSKLKKEMDDPKTKEKIAADQRVASQVGANGTPTFYINGREVVGAQPTPEFTRVIDEEIKKADELIKSGTPLKDVYGKLMAQAAAAPPPPPPAAAPPAPEAKVDVKVGDAPVKGPASAPITLVAYSDFQCPFCSRVVPTLKQLEDDYKGKIRIAFKHQPLPFHDKAHLAAQASLAANEQGKFWQYHDKLFANQQALDRPSLEKYAEELGLNMTKFRAALDTGKFKDRVDRDSQEGNSVGANGTPTFFVNGRKVVGAQPVDRFKAVIDEELKVAKK